VNPAKTSINIGNIDSSVRGVSLLKRVRWTRLQIRLRFRERPESARGFFPGDPVSEWGSRRVEEEFDMSGGNGPVNLYPKRTTWKPGIDMSSTPGSPAGGKSSSKYEEFDFIY
jgi:hypothetical protein